MVKQKLKESQSWGGGCPGTERHPCINNYWDIDAACLFIFHCPNCPPLVLILPNPTLSGLSLIPPRLDLCSFLSLFHFIFSCFVLLLVYFCPRPHIAFFVSRHLCS